MIDVADHADDRYPRLILRWSNLDPFADRIAVRPVTFRHLLVDDHYVGPATGIAIVKLTSLKQRNSHRAEIVGKDATVTDAGRFTGRERSTFNR